MEGIPPRIIRQGETTDTFDNSNEEMDIRDAKDTSLEECMSEVPYRISRPLLITMSIFGLLHLDCKGMKWAVFTKIYSTAILLLLWAFFVRLFFVYQGELMGPLLFAKISIHVWSFHGSVAFTAMYVACRRRNIIDYMKKWTNLMKTNRQPHQAFEKSPDEDYIKKMKFLFYPALMFSCLVFLIASVSMGYLQFKTSFANVMLAPVPLNHSFAFPLKVLTYVVYVYMTATWIFSLGFFFCVIGVICKEFHFFNDDLQTAVQADKIVHVLGKYRSRHQDICRLTDEADNILRCYIAGSISCCLIAGMFGVYSMVRYMELYLGNIFVMLSNGFWLVTCLIYLLGVSVGGGYLNHLAHSSLKTIHDIKFQKVTTEFSLQMSTFLNKLTGEPIGLTAMDMFVIDKPTILTIGGVFLTYFVVLVQFQEPDTLVASTFLNSSAVENT